MPITISNSSFRISDCNFSAPSPLLFTGEIIRLYNSSSTTSTFEFTNINGIPTSSQVSAFTSSYILVKSSSVSDSYNTSSFIVAIDTLITGSELGGAFSEQLITTTGTGTWTKPAGVTQVIVECWGAGGAGGGCTTNNSAGGGGAGGQYARKLIVYPTAQQSVSYTVGVGGTAGTGNGTSGGDTTWNTTQVVAKGGGGGTAGTVATVGGAGGTITQTGAVGDVIYIGAIAGAGSYNPPALGIETAFGGNGGGGPGSTGAGAETNFPNPGTKEYGGDVTLGGGGEAGVSAGGNGSVGANYGGGGSGGGKLSGPSRSGGNGAQGLIRILYR